MSDTTGWKTSAKASMNKGAKATNASAMLADIVSSLSDEQVVEFMANEQVVDAFGEASQDVCSDQADFIAGIDSWDDDFKEVVFGLFKSMSWDFLKT